MKKIHYIKCNKNRKIQNPKKSYIFDKLLAVSIICDTYRSNDEKLFKEEVSIEIL